MNDTTPLPTDWFHYYQQTTAPATPAIAAGGYSNPTSTIANNNISTPNNSTTSTVRRTHTHLNPQVTVLAKPIRKPSRNSRRTPTTPLNASTANFRSLVQQFTGCHNTKTSLNFQKGPVNLTFGTSRSQNIELGTSSPVATFGFGYYNQQPTNPAQLQHQQHQEMVYPKQHENMKSSTYINEVMDESSFNGSRKDGYCF